MILHQLLLQRKQSGKPIRAGLIGAGKFGSMFLSQARFTPGLHMLGVADLLPDRARRNLQHVGWPADQIAARSLSEALERGTTWVGDDAAQLIADPALDVVIDATGHPPAGIDHALASIAHGKHIVMVNVEADALAGPLLAQKARHAGVVYSLAYGDQPALISELVEWARASGLEVVAAGKGSKYLPEYHHSTPETVWNYYGLTAEEAQRAGMNSQMFNSFLDGTKSAIEMAAVSNACDLTPAPGGLAFPPCGAGELASMLCPREAGGQLHHRGQVEVVSSLHRDGSPVAEHLRWAVFVVFAAPSDYVRDCFAEYGLRTDPSGRYAAMHRPYHFVGLETGISVASAALRRESTGAPTGFRADVVAVAKKDLAAGDVLDGEGGYTVWGKLMPAADSLRRGGFPVGLAHGVKLRRAVKTGAPLTWSDVIVDEANRAVQFRQEMERAFAPAGAGSAVSTVVIA